MRVWKRAHENNQWRSSRGPLIMKIMAKARDRADSATAATTDNAGKSGDGGGGGGFAAFSKRSKALGEFERVVREKCSGALRITSGTTSDSTTLWLKDGVVVWADGGQLSERLGRVMVAHELLSWEEYAAALDSLASRQEARMGDLVSDLRMAKREQVVSGLHLQVRLRAAAALSDLDATADFLDGAVRNDAKDGHFPADLSLLYMDISKRLDDDDVKSVLRPLAHQYARVTDPSILGTAPEALRNKMRSLVDVHEIVEAHEGERALFMGMLLADALELADAPFPGKRIEDEVPEESEEPSGINLARKADPRVDSDAPPKPAEERPSDSGTAALGNPDPSNIARLKLNRVQLSVRKVPERTPWDDRDARLLSEMHYVNARSLCRVGQWERAKAELQKAHAKAPLEMEYATLLAYVQWQSVMNAKGPKSEECTTALSNLEALLAEALATSHAVAIVHYIAGEIAMNASAFQRALAAYRRALSFEPTFVDAAQRARQAERRLASEGAPKPKPRPAKPELVVEAPASVKAPAEKEDAVDTAVPVTPPSSQTTRIALALIVVVLVVAYFLLKH